jgi:hypothetical protein
MDEVHTRRLLIADITAYQQILDSRGIPYEMPYTDAELAKLKMADLKILHTTLRDLSRTPSGTR